MTTCKKCKASINSQYCPFCGHPIAPPKINSAFIVEELRNIFNLERGIFFSIKALSLAPGFHVREYIQHDRNRLVKPILFLIICSLAYTFLLQFIGAENVFSPISEEETTLTIKMMGWIIHNSGYANIIMSVFIGFWLQILFKKHQYTFFEILILLCFVMGIGMLIYTLFLLLAYLLNINLDVYASIVSFVYCAWAIASFYNGSKVGNFLKALLAYFVGAITFYLGVFVLGQTISAFI